MFGKTTTKSRLIYLLGFFLMMETFLANVPAAAQTPLVPEQEVAFAPRQLLVLLTPQAPTPEEISASSWRTQKIAMSPASPRPGTFSPTFIFRPATSG